MPYKVFISYSTKDLSLAAHIKNLLQNSGIKVFVAEYSLPAGSELTASILNEIQSCDLFLLLWSHNAKSSEWVPQEIGAAKALKKPVIPIMLNKSGEAPGFLKGLKYLPLYKDPAKTLAWLRKHITHKASEKNKNEGLAWLGISGVILWALSQGKS